MNRDHVRGLVVAVLLAALVAWVLALAKTTKVEGLLFTINVFLFMIYLRLGRTK